MKSEDKVHQDHEKTEIINYLMECTKFHERWVFRKEIAAWSSFVFYSTFVYGLIKGINALDGTFWPSIVLGISVIIGVLFYYLFLFKHYGSLISSMAYMHSYAYWLLKVHSDDGLFSFSTKSDEMAPECIEVLKKEKYDELRKATRFKKFCIPFEILYKKLFKKKIRPYNAVEIQESILYNWIILSGLLLLIYLGYKMCSTLNMS